MAKSRTTKKKTVKAKKATKKTSAKKATKKKAAKKATKKKVTKKATKKKSTKKVTKKKATKKATKKKSTKKAAKKKTTKKAAKKKATKKAPKKAAKKSTKKKTTKKVAKKATKRVTKKKATKASDKPKKATAKKGKKAKQPTEPEKPKKPKKRKAMSGDVVEQLYFRSDSAYFCMILNNRTSFVRVIDFRAGPLPAKRVYLQSVCKERGIRKVITLVEKDEVSSWTRVGFVREGTIPGFYKRSDGHLCGCVIGDRTASASVADKDVKKAERTINAAKKLVGGVKDKFRATVKEVSASPVMKVRDSVWKSGKGLHFFDDFGRDAARKYFESKVRKSHTQYISAEFQDCFGHSLIEILRVPETDDDVHALVAALRHAGDLLTSRGIVSAFSFGPSDDVTLSTAYLAAGYRKTGLLAEGVMVGDERRDAILWTRKLANPIAEENK